jgi:hypothetical protein
MVDAQAVLGKYLPKVVLNALRILDSIRTCLGACLVFLPLLERNRKASPRGFSSYLPTHLARVRVGHIMWPPGTPVATRREAVRRLTFPPFTASASVLRHRTMCAFGHTVNVLRQLLEERKVCVQQPAMVYS